MDFMIWIWIVLTVAFAIAEAASPQLISIWLMFGSLAALIASAFSLPLWIQLTLFVCVSVIMLAVSRPILKKYLKVRHVSTNADRYIGQTAIVTDEIDNNAGRGQVTVEGTVWTARSETGETFLKDEKVTVKAIEGVKLIVARQSA